MGAQAVFTKLTFRKAQPQDAAECGRIRLVAFNTIADQHNVPRESPPNDNGSGIFEWLFADSRFYCVVAELDGHIVGSNCMDERNAICGIGPLTIDPSAQNGGIGRALMQAVLDHANEQKRPGARLLQSAYHTRSFSLYSKLGFVAREQIARMQGPAISNRVDGHSIRKATTTDLATCNQICFEIHGHDRSVELADAIALGAAIVVEHSGTIVGYSSGFSYKGHSVARDNRALMAMLSAAPTFEGTGFLLPTSNVEVLRWCLENGLKILQLNTLMTLGLYNEPKGAWMPSILY